MKNEISKVILKIVKRTFWGTAIVAFTLFITIALLLFSRFEKRPKSITAASTKLYDHEYSSASAKAEEWLNSTYTKSLLPSISVAIGIHGELVWAGAIGHADVDKRSVATTFTVYSIGSISKALTSTALMKLHELEVLDINHYFDDYVKDFPPKEHRFTLKHLASHQSGIRSYKSGISILGEMFNRTEYTNSRDAASLVEEDALLFEPGTDYRYSAFGYTLLSLAMENAANKPFEKVMKDFLFDPVGMSSTHLDRESLVLPNKAKEYILAKGKLFRPPHSNVSYKYAGGGMLSSPSDLVYLGNALLFDRYLQPENKKTLWQSVDLSTGKNPHNYALGFDVGKVGKSLLGTSIRHGGSTNGSFSYFVIFPENELVVAFMSNAKPLANSLSRIREMERIGSYFLENCISCEMHTAE